MLLVTNYQWNLTLELLSPLYLFKFTKKSQQFQFREHITEAFYLHRGNLKPSGQIQVPVTLNDESKTLPLVIVDGAGPMLFGRNWLHELHLNWQHLKQINQVTDDDELRQILDLYSDIFKDELRKLSGATASFTVDPTVPPKFHRPRSIAYALRPKVEAELDRLVKNGIIEPVAHSDWAAPIVPVLKSDGNIRICGDYKVTINKASKLEQYPIPLIEDLFASLSGGKTFTKLDMSHAYQQLVLDENS